MFSCAQKDGNVISLESTASIVRKKLSNRPFIATRPFARTAKRNHYPGHYWHG